MELGERRDPFILNKTIRKKKQFPGKKKGDRKVYLDKWPAEEGLPVDRV
jgi:hypothetical protein